ncbi:ParB N-terminal domain-containing protein [Brachybacterium tyrofermentans]|uniref:ParB N-terminal domain-containing protein n=1 Tax=Brachybacterium tyrofermentans TaxID=47848 RepID=UPI001866AC3D|nr:ParB N-terminal domain-containing protein [Brachybacterium tyrofermentans]
MTDKVPALGNVQQYPIADVRPAPDNPRIISEQAVEMVARSLTEFGWQQPLVVDADGVLIAGHTRLQAAQQLKLRQVPVVIADGLTPEQVQAYRIADNRTSDYSSWDFQALTNQLDSLADDFSDVLGLADWDAVMSDFDTAQDDGTKANNGIGLDLPDAELGYLTSAHQVTVAFETAAAKADGMVTIMDMDGVADVRDKR